VRIIKSRPHYTPKEFKNGVLTLKANQMFFVHTVSEEFKNAAITSHFGFVFEENSVRDIMGTKSRRFQFPSL